MDSKKVDLSSLKIDRSNNYEGKNRSKYLIYTVIVIAIVVAGYFIFRLFSTSAIKVKLTTVVKQSPAKSNAVLTASGYIVAQREASVSSKGTGVLEYLGVVEGDKVKKGQIIARLDDRDIVAQLDEAKSSLQLYKAQLKEVENNYNREKELFNRGLSSQQALDQAESTYNILLANISIAEARIRASEVALENMIIRAPFDGTVLTKNAEVGEIVAPFGASTTSRAAVVTIADMTSLMVETDVSESNIEKIKQDLDCEIVLDAYSDKSYQGYVFKIVPTADRSKATVLVKVGFKSYDNRVLPEMSAKVSFLSEKKEGEENQLPVLTIPLFAVDEVDGKKIVYSVMDDKAIQKEIVTGRLLGNYVEIISGLKEGDEIIDNLDENINDGVQVKVL
ncbi:MAG: efflux RND transporter periplasmic adaptor subunit [Ignavibacteria bacterium]|nr:efflux RND transporter periplasmic adaptor subunit [Ignavibacteria bacterium]MBT8381432.1 efflux RND transporter periplasmic adaptor subunit [Ignavibacteria bacterium]MBT8392285.1 efflux RND transporter periplasmic adaptor subunit [Ignavibacteria bacterium]NNJ52294.1 efflux RND transporter periplasmic adaptor subunit [Ignavibacteriaceae bacterium]NNL20380.1 efflux RND transporter periplasmic adaptor subunit [Ignavibacteriaceae bacterium]